MMWRKAGNHLELESRGNVIACVVRVIGYWWGFVIESDTQAFGPFDSAAAAKAECRREIRRQREVSA